MCVLLWLPAFSMPQQSELSQARQSVQVMPCISGQVRLRDHPCVGLVGHDGVSECSSSLK